MDNSASRNYNLKVFNGKRNFRGSNPNYQTGIFKRSSAHNAIETIHT